MVQVGCTQNMYIISGVNGRCPTCYRCEIQLIPRTAPLAATVLTNHPGHAHSNCASSMVHIIIYVYEYDNFFSFGFVVIFFNNIV